MYTENAFVCIPAYTHTYAYDNKIFALLYDQSRNKFIFFSIIFCILKVWRMSSYFYNSVTVKSTHNKTKFALETKESIHWFLRHAGTETLFLTPSANRCCIRKTQVHMRFLIFINTSTCILKEILSHNCKHKHNMVICKILKSPSKECI